MIRFICAIILSIIVLLPEQQFLPTCVISDGSNIPADLAAAQTGPRCMEIAAGTFTIAPTSGAWLNVTADTMNIHGAGIGKTIIQTTGVTLTSNLTLIQLHGAYQRVSDLTIQIGTGYSGTGSLAAINAYTESTYPTIERVEVSGGYNGGAITTYRSWTAAAQYATIRDCHIHDSPTHGMIVNSSYNMILHNRIERVGNGPLLHGMYIQGGYNLIDGNYVVNASGYSFHAWKKVSNIDASGDRYINNTSIDPGSGHIVVSGLGTLTRNVTITGNIFRATHPTLGVSTDVPALISGNTFEDVASVSGGVIGVNAGAVGSVVSVNTIRYTQSLLSGIGLRVDAAAQISNNTLDMPGLGYGAWLMKPGIIFSGNRISGGLYGWQKAVSLYSTGVIVSENVIDMPFGTGISGTPPTRATDNLIWIGGILQ